MDRKLFSLGLFVVVSLGLLVWLASQLGVIGTRAVDQYTVRLDNAAGLVTGNAIKSSGVEIGRVGSVTLVRDANTKRTMAEVNLNVNSGTPILSDAEVSVAPKSLLGEKFLDLEQGTHPGAKELTPGSQLPDGIKSVDVADIFDLARPLVESEEDLYPVVVELAKRLNHLVGALDPEDKAELKKSFSNLNTKVNSILDNTDTLTQNAVGMINENREELNAILDRTRELVERPELDSILKRGNHVLF
ncbi:MAG: MlaD family protein, partial [Nannocystaceae bacterium]